MKAANFAVLGAVMAVVFTGAACAQAVMPAPLPSSAPVPAPAAAASKPIPSRSAAVKAAENANEPGKLSPEQRVIPQIVLPLKGRNDPSPAAASLPVGSVPGAVDDGAARCLASSDAAEKAACERGLAASGTVKTGR